jgi:outer membrane lipoprotein-sorting protein
LSNFKENPGLSDKTFAFSIPRGAEVTNAGPVKR